MARLLSLVADDKIGRMRKIAYLCSQVTIPGSPNRRFDAFEHDRTMDALRPAFQQRGLSIEEVCWDEGNVDWSIFDAVIIGTAWDYWDRQQLFIETLEAIESQTHLFNSAKIVRWNCDKNYLKQLAARGATLIPTEWIQSPDEANIRNTFDSLGCDDIVVKRQVGAGADGQFRLKRGDEIPSMDRPMMAQPFFPSIQTEGELSLIFIDGKFCHALVKHAAADDYRIQSTYGGTEESISPKPTDLEMAKSVLQALDETPLYARVDMLRSEFRRALFDGARIDRALPLSSRGTGTWTPNGGICRATFGLGIAPSP